VELPNRKQRRLWAKQMGLLKEKSKLSLVKQLEISRRASETGKQIHHRNLERNLEKEEKAREEKIQKENAEKIQKLIDIGYSIEETFSILKRSENDGALDSKR
jgi:hypothetical protein